MELALWDTAGQEDYTQARALAYVDTNVLLIAFSVIKPSSFDNVKHVWAKELKKESLKHVPVRVFLLLIPDTGDPGGHHV